MATLKVFFDMMSQPSRSVLLLLKANKVPFVPQLINIAKGGHYANEEFADVNPSRKVPALKDGEVKLFESTAMMRYICAKYHLPNHWYPQEIEGRAKIDEYLSWHHTNTRLAAVSIIWGKLFGPLLLGKPVNERKIKNGKKQLEDCIKMYDNHFLKDTPYLSSEEISIADVLAICEFSQLELLGEGIVELSNKVKAWQKRCMNYFGDDYHEVHSILYKMKDSLSKKPKL